MTFITKVHIKDRTAPTAFCMPLRNICRTVITRYGDTPVALAQMFLSKRVFDVAKNRKLFFVSLWVPENKVNSTTISEVRAERCSQLVAHIRLWQWQIKVRKELSVLHFHLLFSKSVPAIWANSSKLKCINIPWANSQLSTKDFTGTKNRPITFQGQA